MHRTHWTRRGMIGAGVAASLAPPSALAQTGQVEDVEALFMDDAEPRPETLIGTRALGDWPLWSAQKPRPAAVWHAGETSIDLGHLAAPKSSVTVRLDAALFRRALATCFIDETTLGSRVLFGLRGARLANPGDFRSGRTFAKTVSFVEDTPDHMSPRCIVGVWDRASGLFWATQASTVCNLAYLFGQAKAKTKETLCNLLPAGVYQYRIGTHRNGSNSRQPAAFILDSSVMVARNYDEASLGFSRASLWEARGPDVADNIHAAYYARPGMPEFSSAGCQTLPGTVWDTKTRARHDGFWREFRIAAGLKPDPTILIDPGNAKRISTTEDWNAKSPEAVKKRFNYVLMTGRELAILQGIKPADDRALAKLRRGASGPIVRKLQAALNVPVDGGFGFRTQQAVVNLQSLAGWADGVLTRSRLADLGLPDVFA
jgi:endonuclease G